MPSYTLANWDGSQSKHNTPARSEKQSLAPLTFGTPTRLLSTSSARHSHLDISNNAFPERLQDRRPDGREVGGVLDSSILFKIQEFPPPPAVGTNKHLNHQKDVGLIPYQQYPANTYGGGVDGGAERILDELVVMESSSIMSISSSSNLKPLSEAPPRPFNSSHSWHLLSPKVDHHLSSIGSPNGAASEFNESCLFTPSPGLSMSHSLFTPSPSPPSAPHLSRKKRFLAYVAVPRLPAGLVKTNYRPMIRKKRRPPPHVQIHRSIGDALQASLDNNANFAEPESPIMKNRTAARKIIPKNPFPRKINQVNARSGPSSKPMTGATTVVRKNRLMVHEDQISERPRKKLKVSEKVAGVEDVASHAGNRDNSGDGNGSQRVKPMPSKEYTKIHLQKLIPVSPTVLLMNIRFLRHAQTVNTGNLSTVERGTQKRTRQGRVRTSWILWPPPTQQEEKEILVGYWKYLWDSEDEQEEGSPQANRSSMPTYQPVPQLGIRHKNTSLKFAGSDGEIPSSDPVEIVEKSLNRPTPYRQYSSSVPETEDVISISSSTTPMSPDDIQSPAGIMPSAKALGKRKAVSPLLEPQFLSSPSPTIPYLSDPDDPKQSDNEFPSYIHELEANLARSVQPALESYDDLFIEQDNLEGPAVSPKNFGIRVDDFPPRIADLPSSFSSSRLSGPLDVSPEYETTAVNPWITNNNLDMPPEYSNGTIDPSLLGGSPAKADDFISPTIDPISSLHQLSSTQTLSNPYSGHPSRPQTSRHSWESPSPTASSSHLPISSSSRSFSPSRRSSPGSDNEISRPSPSRPRRQAHRSNMIRTDQLDLSSNSDYESDSYRRPKTLPKHKPDTSPQKKVGRRPQTFWPQDTEPEYCHQCRTKTLILKKVCEACGKKYCVRCLSTRYPDEKPFDLAAEYVCSFCNKTCSCDVCTRKRGDVYNPLRFRKPDQPRPSLGGKTNLPARKISGPVSYWGAMYDLTGQKIGTAFAGNDGNDEVVVVRNKSLKRVFTGSVEPSWGLGSAPIVQDLEPAQNRDVATGKRLRQYIGNKQILSMPISSPFGRGTDVSGLGVFASESAFGEEYGGDDLNLVGDYLSSLSPLPDDPRDEGGEGEYRQWSTIHESNSRIVVQGGLDHFLERGPSATFSPDSLGDSDVVRAIALSLRACGLNVSL